MALAALGSCHVTSSRQEVNENLQFSKFLEHTKEFSIFFREIYIVARSYQATADIKNLLISAQVSQKTRFKVPTFANFWRFLAFFKLSVLTQDFSSGESGLLSQLSTPNSTAHARITVWLVRTLKWWHDSRIPLECLECEKYLTCYVIHDVIGQWKWVKYRKLHFSYPNFVYWIRYW